MDCATSLPVQIIKRGQADNYPSLYCWTRGGQLSFFLTKSSQTI